jgi:hypothetical protein
MTKNLPAYRYELFIKVFEAKVAAAQREIENARRMEGLYNLVKEAMEVARLPNYQNISFHSSWLIATVIATPTDRIATFDEAAKIIGARLHKADMHRDGEPAIGYGTYSCSVSYVWHLGDKRVSLAISVPESGLIDLAVTKHIETSECEVFKLNRIEPPSYAAPPAFKTVGDHPAVSAADDEILF